MSQIFVGFLPWIIYWVGSGSDAVRPAILGALLSSAGLVGWRYWRKRNINAMEAVTLGFFGLHALVTLALGLPLLIRYGPIVNNLTLATMAFGTLLAGSPFTYQYARESWPREVWDNPLFRRTNELITAVWGAIFLTNTIIGALSLAVPNYQLLLNAILANVLIVLGIVFSSRFPNWYTRHTIGKQIAAREPYGWAKTAFAAQPPAGAQEHDVIVIGSGIGGLSAAALLAKRGLKVAVFEQHFLAGGYCTSWERGVRRGDTRLRYVFDAGVHDVSGLGARGPVRLLLRQLGIEQQIDWRRMDHEYALGDVHIKIPRDPQAFAEALAEQFPAERAAIAGFFSEMEQIYRELYADIERSGGAPTHPQTVDEMLEYPQKHPHLYRWMGQPFSAILDSYFHDAQLKGFLSALTGYLSDDSTVLTVDTMAPIFGYYFDGGYYPAGGSQVLADALVAIVEQHGGSVQLRTPVKRILVESGRAAGVELGDGTVHRAQALISNADLKHTFAQMVGYDRLPAAFVQQIEQLKPATSAFMLFLGTSAVPDIEPITMIDDIGIMVPSKADPSLAPAGHSAITLIKLIPQAEAASWDRAAPGYRERKRRAAAEMIAQAERVIPGLSQQIVYQQEAAPPTFARYAWASGGSIYGPAWSSKRPPLKTPIRDLYLAGAGVFPGPGIEAVVISGVLAADAIFQGQRAQRPQLARALAVAQPAEQESLLV